MDLEHKGKKMLEALAVQGQIVPLERKIQELIATLQKAEADVQMAKDAKEANAQARQEAELRLSAAKVKVEEVKEEIKQANINLHVAEAGVSKATDEVEPYSNAFLDELDEGIKAFEEIKEAIETDISGVRNSLESVKKDLAVRQVELKELNIDLGFVEARSPKTTTL